MYYHLFVLFYHVLPSIGLWKQTPYDIIYKAAMKQIVSPPPRLSLTQWALIDPWFCIMNRTKAAYDRCVMLSTDLSRSTLRRLSH